MNWDTIKEIFFFVGSAAGLFAFFKPLLNDKLELDRARVRHIRELISEDCLLELRNSIDIGRVPDELLSKLRQLASWESRNSDQVRFSGPTHKLLTKEICELTAHYWNLFELMAHEGWGLEKLEDGTFNMRLLKHEFDETEYSYIEHLDECDDCVLGMLKSYRRFVIVSELHVYELLVSRYLLHRRFKRHALS